jgi:hypothetical protein
MAPWLRRKSGEVLLVALFCISPAFAQASLECDNNCQQSKTFQPALICSADMSCFTFNEQGVAPTTAPFVYDLGPIVTAPSGGFRALVGANMGSSFGNLFFGPSVALEWPITRHFELDLKDNFSPIEQHIALGNGWANQVYAGGIGWITQSVGVNGNVEYSNYKVSISKHAEYAAGGITYRTAKPGIPMRFTFDYLTQLQNGIDATGTESAHLKAGQFNLDMRVACHLNFCFRLSFDFKIGHVLTQGNPQCDGTYGPTTCPRSGASSGAFSSILSMEFPRRRATEANAF